MEADTVTEWNHLGLSDNEAEELVKIHSDFMKSYADNKDQMAVANWLLLELRRKLPVHSDKQLKEMQSDILETLQNNEQYKNSLKIALHKGMEPGTWLHKTLIAANSSMTTQQMGEYLSGIDYALADSNARMYNVITNKSGLLNLNPNLDGLIAEQYHVNSFNQQAKLMGSKYHAEVLLPEQGTYGKNSVDIVIRDETGAIVRKYQSKYGTDAKATQNGFNQGEYRFQKKLVPEGQSGDVSKSVEFIEAPDGIRSSSLSKSDAKKLQEQAQSGEWQDANWNEYMLTDLTIGIGKHAGYAALQGAAIGAGMDIATKLYRGEKIKTEDVVETALISGADFGVKAATAGALKVASEKGVLAVIPKGTPAGTIANIAFVAVENVKVASKIVTGEMTLSEGLKQMEVTTASTVAGIAASAKGTALGASIGMVFGPVGAAVGGLVGGTIGYMAGSKIGETVAKGVQKVRDYAVDKVKELGSKLSNAASKVGSFLSGLFA
jgi:hypothetical protein